MEGVQAVLRGAMIGLLVAAPIGPNAALCIRRTLHDGPRAGVRSGLGAASIHAFYAGLAIGGVGGVSEWLLGHRSAVRLVGGLLLIGLGLRLAHGRRPTGAGPTGSLSTLVVGLTNPLTLVTFGAVAATGLAAEGGAPLVVAGVFAGSALWWSALAYGVAGLGRRLSEGGARWVNRASAATLVGWGVLAISSVV